MKIKEPAMGLRMKDWKQWIARIRQRSPATLHFGSETKHFSSAQHPSCVISPGLSDRSRIALQLRGDDLVIASYPRSGNTWMRYLLADLILQSRGYETETKLPVHADKIIPDLDRGDIVDHQAELPGGNRIFKTHLMHQPCFRHAIVIFREPWDSLCSHYHFCLRYPETKHVESLGIDRFCEERMHDWMEHLRSFIRAQTSFQCRCFFVSYEQMHIALPQVLKAVCRFFSLEVDGAAIAQAIHNHQFELHASRETPKAGTTERFFRQGQIGSAERELSTETLSRIRCATQEVLAEAQKQCFPLSLLNSLAALPSSQISDCD
jgi:Sulfotransferase domain